MMLRTSARVHRLSMLLMRCEGFPSLQGPAFDRQKSSANPANPMLGCALLLTDPGMLAVVTAG
jgi:hypothetical protein